MSQRTLLVTGRLVDATGAALAAAPCSVAILTPAGAPAIDGNGAEVQTAPVAFVTQSDGSYSQTVEYPGDFATANCRVRVVENGVTTDSPTGFGYAASIATATWYSAASTTGKVRLRLLYVTDAGTPVGGAKVTIQISQMAVDPTGAQVASSAAQSVQGITDSTGTFAFWVWPNAVLNPTATFYTARIAGESGTLTFTAPTAADYYQGAYAAGTTYHAAGGTSAGDVVLSGGVLYRAIATTTGNAPPNATYFQVVSGLPSDLVTQHYSPASAPGTLSTQAGNIVASATVTALPDDPIAAAATLDDQLVNLAARAGLQLRTVTASTTALESDDWILADATGGNLTLTLMAASARVRPLRVIRTDAGANTVSIAGAGGDVINGAATLGLNTQYLWAVLKPDTAGAWYAQTGTGSGGSGPVTTRGDLIVGNASGVAARLPLGTGGQIVGPVGADAAWITPIGVPGIAGAADATSAEGDLLYRRKRIVTALAIGFIGDSITSTVPTGGNAPPSPCCSILGTNLGITCTPVNEGVSGTSTADWLPGSTNLTSAKVAFGGPAATPIVHIMLGTNDARAAVRASAATYQANLQAIVNDLAGAGYKVALSYPPYAVPGSSSGDQDATANTLRLAYQAAITRLVNGRDVFLADTTAFVYFQATPSQLADGIHPTAAGASWLGISAWAAGLQPLVAALTQQATLQRLGIGANGQVLTAAGGYPAWQASPTGFANPMTQQDDLILGGAGGAAGRLGKGAAGQVLTTNAGTGHVDWETPASGFADPTTTKGDLIVHGATTTRQPVGADGTFLGADSAQATGVKWTSPPAFAPAVTGFSPGPQFIDLGDGTALMVQIQ